MRAEEFSFLAFPLEEIHVTTINYKCREEI
jgi:hypothetical protein